MADRGKTFGKNHDMLGRCVTLKPSLFTSFIFNVKIRGCQQMNKASASSQSLNNRTEIRGKAAACAPIRGWKCQQLADRCGSKWKRRASKTRWRDDDDGHLCSQTSFICLNKGRIIFLWTKIHLKLLKMFTKPSMPQDCSSSALGGNWWGEKLVKPVKLCSWTSDWDVCWLRVSFSS